MAISTFRCGSSNAVYYAPPVVHPRPAACLIPAARADTEPVRLRTRLHLGSARPATHGFRVIAELADGDTALVCLGATRGEVIAGARAKAAALAARVVGFLLQQWVGRLGSGHWQTLPLRRGELAAHRRRAPRRPRRAAVPS
jgi:hypothetical protein